MATTPANKAASGEGEMPAGKTAKAAKGAAVPGPAKARAAKGTAAPGAGGGALVEKANLEVKLKDLIEKVTASTGAKKPQVRSVIEAMLKEMGDALGAAQVLNLPGLGKLRVVKQAETATGTMTIKLRRGTGGGQGGGQGGDQGGRAVAEGGAEPLAEPGEDS